MTPQVATAAAGAAASVGTVAVNHALGILADLPHDGNIVSYGRAAEVVPMCLVDESCSTSELLEPTLQTLLAVYAGHYFRAFTMHNISIGGKSIHRRLDKFSTDRSALSNIGMEDFKDGLPTMGELSQDTPEDLEDLIEEGLKIEQEALKMMAVGNEAHVVIKNKPGEKPEVNLHVGGRTWSSASKNATGNASKSTDKSTSSDSSGGGKTIDLSLKQADLSGPVNFATGLTVNLKISENGNTVVVPVTIRLNAMYMAPSPLVAILGFSANDISFGARWKKWRLGGIDFWNDLVLCQDLIDEHKKNIRADKTGVYLKMMNRRRQNSLTAALSGSGSANSSSNIVVMSEETAAALELKAGGRLDHFQFRERLFAQGYGIMFAIISQRRGRVRFYTRSIPDYTEVSERDMKAATKGNSGPDVADILNAFRAGSSFRM